jgi:hypothetical protein
VLTLIAGTTPANLSDRNLRRAPITTTFRWPMYTPSMPAYYTLKTQGGSAVPGTISWPVPGLTMLFTPSQPLASNATYTATVGIGARRMAGGAINVAQSTSFTTEDQIAPVSALPNPTNAARNSTVTVTFDRAVRSTTVTPTTVTITPSAPGTLKVSGSTISFVPTGLLAASTSYTITVGGSVTGLVGFSLSIPYSYTFKTGTFPVKAASVASMAVAEALSPPLSVHAAAAPARSGVTAFTVELTSAASVSVAITNTAGRPIAKLPLRQLTRGLSTLTWDGKSANGTRVPAGEYFAQVLAARAEGSTAHCQIPFRR